MNTPVKAACAGLIVLVLASCASKECIPSSDVHATAPVDIRTSAEERSFPIKRAVLAFSGPFCDFYLTDVEEALMNVPGVIEVDFKTVKRGAVVAYEAGRLNPIALLAAVRGVKGDGYACKAKVIPG
jgi:copper chaperone CopZ